MPKLRPVTRTVSTLALGLIALLVAIESATAEPEVILLERGAEPWKTLRLHPSPGLQQTTTILTNGSMTMSQHGREATETQIPAMAVIVSIGVQSISSRGDIRYELSYESVTVAETPGVPPVVAEQLERQLTTAVGVSGTGIHTSRGFYKDLRWELPANVDPQISAFFADMKNSFNQLSVVLPAETVGTGAQWEVQEEIARGDTRLLQTKVYRIESMQDDMVELLLEVDMLPRSDNAVLPLANKRPAYVSGTGTGRTTLNLTGIMPVASELTMSANTATVVSLGATQTEEMSVLTRVKTTMKTE